jgi:hypothetical protein
LWGINTAEKQRTLNQEDNQAPQPTNTTISNTIQQPMHAPQPYNITEHGYLSMRTKLNYSTNQIPYSNKKKHTKNASRIHHTMRKSRQYLPIP